MKSSREDKPGKADKKRIIIAVWCPFCDWRGYASVSDKELSIQDYECPECGCPVKQLAGKTASGRMAKLKKGYFNK